MVLVLLEEPTADRQPVEVPDIQPFIGFQPAKGEPRYYYLASVAGKSLLHDGMPIYRRTLGLRAVCVTCERSLGDGDLEAVSEALQSHDAGHRKFIIPNEMSMTKVVVDGVTVADARRWKEGEK